MAKRSGCPAKGKPPPSNTFLHCVCADVSLTPRPAQAQRRRAIYIRRRTRSCAGWRHKCLIRPTGPPAGSNSVGPRKRSAAGQGIIEWSSMKSPDVEKQKPSHRLGSLNKWCPDSESNQGHGDFQSPALPTELSGQRGALNRNPPTPSTKFLKLLVDCLSLRQFRIQRRILTQYHCMPLSPSRLFQPLVTEITWRNPEIR